MVKKRQIKSKPKAMKRTSTMLNVVAQGEKFLESTKKKKATRTKTMAETIKEGTKFSNTRPKRAAKRDDSRSQSVQPKDAKKKEKKIVKSRVSKKTASKKVAEKVAKKVAKKYPKKVPKAKVPISLPKASPISSAPIKKTIFKTKSKDHLPIPAFGFIDVCFCIDTTGSMCGELTQAQSTIRSIIQNIEKKVQTEGLTLRFAVVAYRDHPPQDHTYVTQTLDFTDHQQVIKYVNKLNATGGGDFPEAVHDGLITSANDLNWVQVTGAPVLRYIFHIADAPPHGKQFGFTHEKDGCLCGKQTAQIYHAINMKQIHYRLIKARTGPQLNQMQEMFKKNIVNFDSTDISHAKEMDVKVSDMIIMEVLPDFA